MKFSIKTLLAVTLLIALIMIAYGVANDLQKNRQHFLETKMAIAQFVDEAYWDKEVLERTLDEFSGVAAIEQQAMEAFHRMQAEEDILESRGDDVFSIRTSASMPQQAESTVRFRLLVPEKRSVWLHLGVTPKPVDTQVFAQKVTLPKLLSESPFTQTGPYEMQLTQGAHTLSITTSRLNPSSPCIRIQLNERICIDSTYQSSSNPHTRLSNRAGREQADVRPDQRLPWLCVAETQLEPNAAASQHLEAVYLWLSDQALDYASFPGAQ